MYEYIKGTIEELTPTYVIMECAHIGYFINISLNTYSQLSEKKESLLFLHQVVREDAHLLFGFAQKTEREIFRQLITVSGIGSNTARMMLSSLSPDDIQNAIITGNVGLLKSVKGIGAKSAERIIVDLRDKVGRIGSEKEIFITKDNTIKDEALSALVMLGFSKNSIEKVLGRIIAGNRDMSVEEMIKEALKQL
ncbi:MAG: Holliday junction branch migration protein RuvA [Bacteroidetes bacterium]|nr:Holliday junction branch migration protein RuvA [Bacteroidota bacterium]